MSALTLWWFDHFKDKTHECAGHEIELLTITLLIRALYCQHWVLEPTIYRRHLDLLGFWMDKLCVLLRKTSESISSPVWLVSTEQITGNPLQINGKLVERTPLLWCQRKQINMPLNVPPLLAPGKQLHVNVKTDFLSFMQNKERNRQPVKLTQSYPEGTKRGFKNTKTILSYMKAAMLMQE